MVDALRNSNNQNRVGDDFSTCEHPTYPLGYIFEENPQIETDQNDQVVLSQAPSASQSKVSDSDAAKWDNKILTATEFQQLSDEMAAVYQQIEQIDAELQSLEAQRLSTQQSIDGLMFGLAPYENQRSGFQAQINVIDGQLANSALTAGERNQLLMQKQNLMAQRDGIGGNLLASYTQLSLLRAQQNDVNSRIAELQQMRAVLMERYKKLGEYWLKDLQKTNYFSEGLKKINNKNDSLAKIHEVQKEIEALQRKIDLLPVNSSRRKLLENRVAGLEKGLKTATAL